MSNFSLIQSKNVLNFRQITILKICKNIDNQNNLSIIKINYEKENFTNNLYYDNNYRCNDKSWI